MSSRGNNSGDDDRDTTMAIRHPLHIIPISHFATYVDTIARDALSEHPMWTVIDRVWQYKHRPVRLVAIMNEAWETLSRSGSNSSSGSGSGSASSSSSSRVDRTRPPTLSWLRKHNFTLADLVVRDADDNGCAFTLRTLYDAGIVTKWNNIIDLKPTLPELFAIGVSTACSSERLNPAILRNLFGDEAALGIRNSPFNFTPQLYAREYATQLTPRALDALGVNLAKWLAAPGVLKSIGSSNIATMLSLGTRKQWIDIGLNESMLVGPDTGIARIEDIPWKPR